MFLHRTHHTAFFAAGLMATAAQVLLLREIVVDIAGDEAAIGIGLAAWLTGIALGAARARTRPADRGPRDAGLGLAVLSLAPTLAVLGGRFLRYALVMRSGELPGLGFTLLLASLTLAPVGAAVGWTFTTLAVTAARTWPREEAVARVYVVESVGSIVGGLAITLLAGRALPLRLAALSGLVGLLLARAAVAGGSLGRLRAHAAAASACAALALAGGPLDRVSERVRFAGTASGLPLQESRDTPYQHLAIGLSGEVRHLYASGQYAASFPDPYTAESLGHLVALLAPRPQRTLVLGGGERGLVPVLLRHPVSQLTLVEPDAGAFRFLLGQLPEPDRGALADARVLLRHDDPRRFLSRPDAGSFGLVVSIGPDPATLLRARLATVEFFRLLASRLQPDGVLVASLPAAPAVLTGESEALAGALLRALREALPVVRSTLANEALAVAGWSAAAVTLDPVVLGRRWTERGLSSPSFDAAVLPVLLPPDRVAAHQALLDRASARAATSRDDRPISFLHALARRQQLVSDEHGRAIRHAVRIPALVLVALAFVPSLVALGRLPSAPARTRAARVASHGVAVSGAAGLGWSLLLLFSFQTHAGALYGQLGALVALFMLGLALGGAASAAMARRTDRALVLFRVLLAAATVFAATLPFTLLAAAASSRSGSLAALVAHGGLLLAAGAATGGVFPIAAAVRLAAGDDTAEAAGRLETADHVGAACAASTGAVLFVPVLGLARSAWLLAALLAFVLAMACWPFERTVDAR